MKRLNTIWLCIPIFRSGLVLAVVLTLNFKPETLNCFAQSRDVHFTLEDRDRNIRMEEKISSVNERISSLEKSMNVKFESMDVRFESIDVKYESLNDKLDKLYTLLYFILGGVFGLIGLIMWDRRSYIKPVKEDIRELQNVLKHYAKQQPGLADILRSHGLM